MAEKDEVTLDDDSIALEDVDESVVGDINVPKTTEIMTKKDG